MESTPNGDTPPPEPASHRTGDRLTVSPAASARTNEFAFKIGTVNGTGSASANGLLLQAIFRMGIPVSGKNIFPSNIQGLPTWYEIRVSGAGHLSRTPDFDLIVTMNPETIQRDIAEVRSGGWVLHDSSWPLSPDLLRSDVKFLGLPLGELAAATGSTSRERVLMKNILYVGALAALLDIDRSEIEKLLQEQFGRKPSLMEANFAAIEAGYNAVIERYDCPLPIRLERMDETGDHILIDGNTAAALGCVYAGATVGAWYPITPATSLMDAFARFCAKYRTDPDGTKRYVIVQAEDELAAAGVVIGAGWAGARSFTPTAGPGISLMSEFLGLAYYAEIPGVFFDVQRTGPSTGMPTRTQQGDLMLVAYASHGDTKHIALFPSDPAECFQFAVAAFDLAERFQTPVFVVSDLDIGMNDWMCPRFQWDDSYRPDRGKVLTAEELETVTGYARYLDVDGDGIAARSLPGVHPAGAYFARGSGHNKLGGYTEDPVEYQEVMDRLLRKVEGAARVTPQPVLHDRPGATLGVISIGGCDPAVREAGDILAREGMAIDYLRIRSFPFSPAVRDFVEAHDRLVVIEQNRDAQLRSLLILELAIDPARVDSLTRYGGMPLSAGDVVSELRDRYLEKPHAIHLQAAR